MGHIIFYGEIESDPKKMTAIINWPRPKNVTDVRSFLGVTNHYHKFIYKCAPIARPLSLLTAEENANKKEKVIEWSEKCEDTFNKLKDLCYKNQILAEYANVFKLYTDASELGMGAALYPKRNDGTDWVTAYASRTLSKSERNYDAHNLEFLALKWAITDHFHEYLYGEEFDVFTDNNPLTHILTTAKLDATGLRWVDSLANYNFHLHYKSGKQNVQADALSRIRWTEGDATTVDQAKIKAVRDMGNTGKTAWAEA